MPLKLGGRHQCALATGVGAACSDAHGTQAMHGAACNDVETVIFVADDADGAWMRPGHDAICCTQRCSSDGKAWHHQQRLLV